MSYFEITNFARFPNFLFGGHGYAEFGAKKIFQLGIYKVQYIPFMYLSSHMDILTSGNIYVKSWQIFKRWFHNLDDRLKQNCCSPKLILPTRRTGLSLYPPQILARQTDQSSNCGTQCARCCFPSCSGSARVAKFTAPLLPNQMRY